jgi:hypothetical protein
LHPLDLFNLEPISLEAIFLPFYLEVACRAFAEGCSQRENRIKSVDYGKRQASEKEGVRKERR